ncbi:hypothetical protein ACH5RR_018165 [Cinchona calisaya]|uniref:Uncharacterized protein n=1 Tax=Cinchona calisaya TaxID=153742 RepID=A0ABD2ZMC3_9GENT
MFAQFIRNHEASIRNLENHMGEIARQFTERPQGTMPSDTIPNPLDGNHREHAKAVVSLDHNELMRMRIMVWKRRYKQRVRKSKKKVGLSSKEEPKQQREPAKYQIPSRRKMKRKLYPLSHQSKFKFRSPKGSKLRTRRKSLRDFWKSSKSWR